jgi:hypothetical protein
MKPLFIYAISILYALQGVQLLMDRQLWPAVLVFVYALAGIPLIMMVQR